jgi:hypothetical protein
MRSVQTRRRRTAGSHAVFRCAREDGGACGSFVAPIPSHATSPEPALHPLSAIQFGRRLGADPDDLASAQLDLSWMPQAAMREGGLWLLKAEDIAKLERAAGDKASAYGADQYGPLFDAAADGGVQLPAVDCARPLGQMLPQRAFSLVRARMCCILDQAKLWPAAEARWTDIAYLQRGLRAVPCNVLSAPRARKRFSYWFNHADRVQAGYKATPLVSTHTMGFEAYMDANSASSRTDSSRCLYLQQTILQSDPRGGPGMVPCTGLGDEMAQDVAKGIDLVNVQALAQAGAFGPWQRCQLFIGGRSTVGARSILHYDQYDNLFLQLAGTKRFRIFDPTQTRCLYPYPVHHPLDLRAQVDLTAEDSDAFPRLKEARSVEIVLRAGQCLFLPACAPHFQSQSQ